jgi:predicted RNA-binding Zn ribbon-like protein
MEREEPGGREPAPGELRLVQAFVNTVDIEDGQEQLGEPEALRAWLRAHDLPGSERPLTETDLTRALAVREAIRALARANNGEALDREALTVLNGANAHAAVRVAFDAEGTAQLRPVKDDLDGALAILLAAVYAAMVDGTWPRLKACRRHACSWLFYDHSKNQSGSWCTMSICGGKEKAKAYRRRRARGTAAE